MRFLGAFELYEDDQPLPELPTRKVKSLFAYLVMRRDRAHPREELAELLWGELGPESARNNLRYALSALRRVLGEHLTIERGWVRFSSTRYALDVEAFERLIEQGRQAEGEARLEAFRRAVELYDGGFLPGFYDDWVLEEQARLEALYVEALDALAQSPKAELLRSPPLRLSEEAGLKRELARAHYARREPEAAYALARQALQLYERAHDPVGRAKSHLLLGVIHRYLGQSDRAKRHYHKALELSRRAQDRRTEWQTLNNLGWLAWNDRHSPEAIEHYGRAFRLCRALDDRWGETIVLNNWGIALLDLEAFREAEARFGEAGRRIQTLDDVDLFIENRSYRARAQLGLGRRGEALGSTRQALELVAAGRGSALRYKVEFNAYCVLRALGRGHEAQAHLRRAHRDVMDRLTRIQDPRLRESALQGNRPFREICEAAREL